MNNIEILEEWIKIDRKMRNNSTESDYDKFCEEKCIAIENLIQENKELKEKINKSIEFINDDDTFFDDGESWQNVLHIERILKGE